MILRLNLPEKFTFFFSASSVITRGTRGKDDMEVTCFSTSIVLVINVDEYLKSKY